MLFTLASLAERLGQITEGVNSASNPTRAEVDLAENCGSNVRITRNHRHTTSTIQIWALALAEKYRRRLDRVFPP